MSPLRSLTPFVLAFILAPHVGAQDLPLGGLVGSWTAASFLVDVGAGAPVDAVERGGAVWLTIDPDGSCVTTTQNPGEAVREAETGFVRVVSAATIQFGNAGEGPQLTFVLAGDTLTLTGVMLLDIHGDGVRQPTQVEVRLVRQAAQTNEGDGVPGAWVRSGGQVRTYRMHVPASLPPGTATPLLLFFHGYQSSAREVQAMAGLDRVADERGFATVYPAGIEASWAIGCGGCTPADARGVDDVALVRTLVAQLGRARTVDRGRVYAGGYSQGGMFSHRLACELADQVAAVASVAGGMTRAVSPRCAPARPLPIALFHGTADPNVPWEGGPFLLSVPETLERWAALNGCAGKAVEPLPDPVPDGTTVRRETCTGCAAGTVLYAIEGGGHTWPGYPTDFPLIYGRTTHDISAADLIGEFFSRQRLP